VLEQYSDPNDRGDLLQSKPYYAHAGLK
jgi:hypothetical protein